MPRTIPVPRGVRSECFSVLWACGASHCETNVTGSPNIVTLSIGVWTMPGISRHAIIAAPSLVHVSRHLGRPAQGSDWELLIAAEQSRKRFPAATIGNGTVDW